MTIIKEQINKIQEEYFEFCMQLLQKIPKENSTDLEQLEKRIYLFKIKLREDILKHFKNFKDESIRNLEEEIIELREKLQRRINKV
jgi:hypothetical protein